MTAPLALAAVLLAGLVLWKVLPSRRRAWVMARLLSPRRLEEVGRSALARQPDRITLAPGAEPSAAAAALCRQIEQLGFTWAASHAVPELPGLALHLYTRGDEGAAAAVYQHPRAGVWFELFTRFADGTSFTCSSASAAAGLDPRPGHPVLRMAGATPSAAHARFLLERPAGTPVVLDGWTVGPAFVDAYAEAIAWRKARGVSAGEVKRVAGRL